MTGINTDSGLIWHGVDGVPFTLEQIIQENPSEARAIVAELDVVTPADAEVPAEDQPAASPEVETAAEEGTSAETPTV